MIERDLYMSLWEGKTITKTDLGRFISTVEQLVNSGTAQEQLTLFTGSEITLFKYIKKLPARFNGE